MKARRLQEPRSIYDQGHWNQHHRGSRHLPGCGDRWDNPQHREPPAEDAGKRVGESASQDGEWRTDVVTQRGRRLLADDYFRVLLRA